MENGQELRQLPGHANWIWSVALAPDGKTALSGGQDNTGRLGDPGIGQGASGAATRAASSRACVSLRTAAGRGTFRDSKVRFLDGKTGKLDHEFTCSVATLDIAFTPDGERFLLGNVVGTPLLCETATGGPPRSLATGTGFTA